MRRDTPELTRDVKVPLADGQGDGVEGMAVLIQ